jgi:hypothetical protein
MAIYRGAGGPGDATTDAANEATVASNKATEAAASAAAAASSASSAASSATSASNSATSASNSATAAASSASAAASSASSAASSASSAGASLSSAVTAQAAAEAAQLAAETAETNAETAQAAAEAAQAAAELAEANAETAEAGAESAQAAAEAARDAALSALDNFDDRYLGAKASDPTLDNDGNALVAGALYFNTTDDVMKVYEGSIWVAAYASVSGALIAAQNLSDLTNVATARTNLGLGTAATTAATDYATAAQGALADSATQPGDNVSTLTNDAGYLTSFTETDPVFVAHPSYGITSTKITNWDTAYGWGNHASAGYLTSYTETDPVFTAHPAYGIDGTDISNWNDSFSFVAGFPTQSGNTGKFLTTDGSALSWGTVSTVGTLDDLTDVTITTPANGEVLKYNGTAWVNSTVTQSTLSFPFYNSAGTADSIALVSNQYLPFYNSAGSASNIAVTSI